MRRILLDQNYIQYFVRGFPKNIDADHERAAYQVVIANPDFRFVLSPWNIVEAARSTEKSYVDAYARFIDKLDPWYIVDHPFFCGREVRTFVFENYFGCEEAAVSPFSTCFSQFIVDLGWEPIPFIGLSPGGLTRTLFRHPEFLVEVGNERMARSDLLNQLPGRRRRH